MKSVTIVLGDFNGEVEGDVIGVDYGAYICVLKDITMMLACGDFDSVTPDQFKAIESYANETAALNPEKDLTDFDYAYRLCADYERILVVGGLGRRRDHEYLNVMIAMQDSRVEIVDDQNRMQRLDTGTHVINKKDYQYISFLIITPGFITLEGFKYPLTNQPIKPNDTFLTSNEIINSSGTVYLEEAAVLMIQSKP